MKKVIILLLLSGAFSQTALSANNLSDTGFYKLAPYSDNDAGNDFDKNGLSDAFNQEADLPKHRLSRPLFGVYSPQYPLWTDGAKKKRWIYLPANKRINTKNKDRWVFPVGTKFWKEFSYDVNGENFKLETRYLEKRGENDWLMQTYVWNEDQTEATLAPAEGIKNFYPLGSGKFYDIPGTRDCQLCHSKAGIPAGPLRTSALGFSALQLSDDRDPNAIHGEPLTADMISLSRLQRMRKITHAFTLSDLPRIPDSETAPLQRRVFGYLHGNCAHCHNDSGLAETVTTADFHHDVNTTHIQQNGTYKTALAKPIASYLQPAGSPELIIQPGNSAASALVYRMIEEEEEYNFVVPAWHHNAGFSLTVKTKMPILGTNIIDQEAVDIISQYIDSLPTH